MNKCSDIDIEQIRLAAANKANDLDVSVGSEEYFRLLVGEALVESKLPFGEVLSESRPLLYKSLDESLDDSVDLVFVDPDYLDYISHALAIEGGPRKFALIPPMAWIGPETVTNVSTGKPIENLNRVRLCGDKLCTMEVWEDMLEELSTFSEILEKCLNVDSERFVGFFSSVGQLESACDGATIGLVRASEPAPRVKYADASGDGWNLNTIPQSDSLSERAQAQAASCINAIVWEGAEENDKDADFGYEEYIGTGHMLKAVEFPKSYKCRLLVWDSRHDGYTGLVAMTSIDERGNEKTVRVLGTEAEWKPFPPYFMETQGDVHYVPLKELVKKISRGTSLKGKDLSICGDTKESSPIVIGTLHADDKVGTYRSDRSYYVDNASIRPRFNNHVSSVVAKRIEKVPSGQERYTLLPEDGDVLLMPRTGKCVARYAAVGPTLVANNLFIIWPDSEKIDPEYLSIAMSSRLVASQFDSGKNALAKSDLEKLLIPMADEDAMAAVISRRQEICEKIGELNEQLDKLRREDPLLQVRSKMDVLGRK